MNIIYNRVRVGVRDVKELKAKVIISIILFALIISVSLILREEEYIETIEKGYEVPIYSVSIEEKVAAITFDINWAKEENLYTILDILDKYNTKATFFIMGAWVNQNDENVEKLKAIVERGHEIGNHSYLHPNFTKIGEEQIKEELRKTNEIIEKLTKVKPVLFRFPSGDYNERVNKVVLNEGFISIQWNCDSVDWKEEGAEIEYSRIKENLKPGSILLFHNNAKYTPENLEKVLKDYQNQEYKFVKVGDLIYNEGYTVEKDGTQRKK